MDFDFFVGLENKLMLGLAALGVLLAVAGILTLARMLWKRTSLKSRQGASGLLLAVAGGGLVALCAPSNLPSNQLQDPPSEVQGPSDPYGSHISRTEPRSPEDERRGFRLPPGFDIELVAAEPDIRKPININFDDRGRLWVTESVEYPIPAEDGSQPRDSVRILRNFNDQGLAQESITFADGLNIPIGILPVTRGAIVYSIPTIQRLEAASREDRADQRTVLYGTFGCQDTHGMTSCFTRDFDGWVYACHGFANKSVVTGADGHSITMESGNTYRFRPDGSRVEEFTHGQVNPFGLAFDPLGNLYACDSETRPIYLLLRGAYYPSKGKPHDGLAFGPEMMTHDHGSTAIAGIAYYAAEHFPAAYRDTIFVGNVVTNRINHDRLEWHGSSPRAIAQPDFLTSDDPWFRPVDIKLAPDGALYVADFYNRIIGHYEVALTHPGRDKHRGRIWRIIYRGQDGSGRPRQPRLNWGKASVCELVQDLADANLTVRMTAMEQLVERGGPAGVAAVARVMQESSNPYQRSHALWVLERAGSLDEATLRAAANDPERDVRIHAMRVLAERAQLSGHLHEAVQARLRDADALVQRNAAEALATHVADENVRPLLDLLHRAPPDDSHLIHVVRMALRNQLRPATAWRHLSREQWSERETRAIADIAAAVPTAEAARYLVEHLEHFSEPHANRLRYAYHIARYGEETDGVVELARTDRAAPLKLRAEMLESILRGTQARGSPPSALARSWGEELVRQLLASNEEGDLLTGLGLGGMLRLQQMQDHIAAAALDARAPENVRQSALAALVAADAEAAIPVLGRVAAGSSEALSLRLHAARLLAETNRPESQDELLRGLPMAPRPLAVAIAVGLAGSRRGGEKLLAAVADGKASALLLQEPRVAMPLDVLQSAHVKKRIAELTRGVPSPDQRLQELLANRRAVYQRARTDAAIGAKVFEKHCAICHQLANRGAQIGPKLDGIGVRGLDRLLEDILDPSRNVDPAFRLTTLGLSNGQIVSGLVLREEGQVLVLADAQGNEVRVPRADIEQQTISPVSPMPANLADQIPEADFCHLLAFLLAQQPPNVSADYSPGQAALGVLKQGQSYSVTTGLPARFCDSHFHRLK
jgi:putative heme-binding domain-containing protein